MNTSTRRGLHLRSTFEHHACSWIAVALSAALLLLAVPASAQVVHPTPAERAQHTAHVQHLKSQQQSRKLRQRLSQNINKTASKAYGDQPGVQNQMQHAGHVRQHQFKARDRDLKKKIQRAARPLPTHVEPASASSG